MQFAGRTAWERADDFRPQEPLTVRLSPGQLRSFEGKYQSEHNPDAVWQAVARENGLTLTELWTGREVRFVPTSETEFRHEDGEVTMPLRFIRGNGGSATQLVVYGRDVYNCNDGYAPRTRREVQLTPAQLKACEGRYRKADRPGDFLAVTVREGGLVLRESWSGIETGLVPENELAFFARHQPFSLRFTKDGEGNVTQMQVADRDPWIKAK